MSYRKHHVLNRIWMFELCPLLEDFLVVARNFTHLLLLTEEGGNDMIQVKV